MFDFFIFSSDVCSTLPGMLCICSLYSSVNPGFLDLKFMFWWIQISPGSSLGSLMSQVRFGSEDLQGKENTVSSNRWIEYPGTPIVDRTCLGSSWTPTCAPSCPRISSWPTVSTESVPKPYRLFQVLTTVTLKGFVALHYLTKEMQWVELS